MNWSPNLDQSEKAARELQEILDGMTISELKTHLEFAAGMDDRSSEFERLNPDQSFMARSASTFYSQEDVQRAIHNSLNDQHEQKTYWEKDDQDEKAYQELETSLLSVSTPDNKHKHDRREIESSTTVIEKSSTPTLKVDQEDKDEEFEAGLDELRKRLDHLRS